jgi:lysophospholipase L1-like esterase
MMVRRFAAFGVSLLALTALTACTQLSQLSAPNPNVSNARTFAYTAIGASDAVGFGASRPCPTAAVVIGSDTEQMPSPANCPNGTGYVPVIAALLTTGTNVATLTDLGISGAVIGPTERTLGNTYEPFIFGCSSSGPNVCIPGDFLTDELPLIPSQQNTVTIFAGGNDTNAIFSHVAVACGSCSPNQVAMMIGTDVTNFGNDYSTLLTAVHGSFPFARIYVANLPNFGLIPRGVCTGAPLLNPPPFCTVNDPPQNNPQAQFLLDQISTAIDAGVINGAIASQGIPVIDVECDAQSYVPSNFYIDGFHPDDAGYALFAAKFTAAIRAFGAPPPPGSCPPFSQSRVRHLLSPIGRVRLVRY